MSSSSDPPVERAPHTPTEHLQGIVERVTFHAEDSGYTVARLKAPGERDLIISWVAFQPCMPARRCGSLAIGGSIPSMDDDSIRIIHKMEQYFAIKNRV